ncbi:hypothetical protein V6N13_141355 [Hibiscus sabdariffa]|uniref:Secreted protein n=1 Tax=Hibiscus sabdariffa TaxID=183260 RepID=A0ABR2P540_9ROSI
MQRSAVFVLPCLVAETAYQVWWYASCASRIPFLGIAWLSDTVACVTELSSRNIRRDRSDFTPFLDLNYLLFYGCLERPITAPIYDFTPGLYFHPFLSREEEEKEVENAATEAEEDNY